MAKTKIEKVIKMKPMIFTTYSVRAIQEGRKTMTRRVIKPQPIPVVVDGENWLSWSPKQPYKPGDIIWVKEAWRCAKYDSMDGDLGYGVEFKDGEQRYFEFEDVDRFHKFGKYALKEWQSPIYMPREAARLFLLVKDAIPERLQDITEEDAIAEGFEPVLCDCSNKDIHGCTDCMNTGAIEPAIVGFVDAWDKLNAKRGYPFGSNPWVWKYVFERTEKPSGF